MLQRLPIALKGGNNSESLLNKIRKIVYSLYQSNMNTIFMNTIFNPIFMKK